MVIDVFSLLLIVMILFLEVRPERTQKYVCSFIISVICWILFYTQIKALSIFMLVGIVDIFLYINNKREFLPILVINGSFVEIFICTLIFSYYRPVQWGGQLTIFLFSVLLFTLIMKYDHLTKCSTGFLLFQFSLLLLCISIQVNAFSGILFHEYITSLVSVMMFVLTCSVIYVSMKKDRIIDKNRFIQKTENISKQQIDNWIYQTDRFLHEKHELIHRLNDICRLIIKDNKNGALSSVEQLMNQVVMHQQNVYCNDIYINSVIQSKACQKNTPFITTDIRINEISTSLSKDICMVLSELIDIASIVINNNNNSGHTLHITMLEKAGTIILKTSYPHQNHSVPVDFDVIMDIINRYHGVIKVEDGEYDTVSIMLIIPEQ